MRYAYCTLRPWFFTAGEAIDFGATTMLKTCHGNCHCGAVKFEAELADALITDVNGRNNWGNAPGFFRHLQAWLFKRKY